MASVGNTPSLNEANSRDPFNNNSYETLEDSSYKLVNLPILDVNDFNERIIRAYENGTAEKELPADLTVARSIIPAGTVIPVMFWSRPILNDWKIGDSCRNWPGCSTRKNRLNQQNPRQLRQAQMAMGSHLDTVPGPRSSIPPAPLRSRTLSHPWTR